MGLPSCKTESLQSEICGRHWAAGSSSKGPPGPAQQITSVSAGSPYGTTETLEGPTGLLVPEVSNVEVL